MHKLKETHDILNVLTGFGIDGAIELGLQGFKMNLETELIIARTFEDGWERPLQEWRQELKLNLN